jgi:SAM-dependent methyltransferase
MVKILNFIKMVKILDFVKEVFKGKSIYRILFNWQVAENCKNLTGEVLDLAGGDKPSYYRYLPKNLKIIRTDISFHSNLDLVVDFNKRLPFADGSQKNIFLFNAINIAKDTNKLFGELFRILAKDGQLFLSSLFIANEMMEPDDFSRLTFQGLQSQLEMTGFKNIKITRIGERFTAATQLSHRFFIFNIVRLFVYSLSLFLDKLIPLKIKKNHSCPIGYFCVVKK